MPSPFAAALDALFYAPGSAAADYVINDQAAQPIRVILSRPSETSGYEGGQIVTDTVTIDIRRSEVALPAACALVRVGTRDDDGVLTVEATYQLSDEPISDVEAMTWTCGAVEITQ